LDVRFRSPVAVVRQSVRAGRRRQRCGLQRGPAGNWTQGGYGAALSVAAGANNGTSLVSFVIPN
jgi:hypothetical protein